MTSHISSDGAPPDTTPMERDASTPNPAPVLSPPEEPASAGVMKPLPLDPVERAREEGRREERERIVGVLEQLREDLCGKTQWTPKKATLTLAILFAKGHLHKNK